MEDLINKIISENFDNICMNGSLNDIEMLINFVDTNPQLYNDDEDNYLDDLIMYVFKRDDIDLIYVVKYLYSVNPYGCDFKLILRDAAWSGNIDLLNYMLEHIIEDHTFIYNTTACSNNPKTKEALRLYEEKLLLSTQ